MRPYVDRLYKLRESKKGRHLIIINNNMPLRGWLLSG